MPVYKNSELTIYSEEDGQVSFSCQVRIDNGSIAISYTDENKGMVVYEGNEQGSGHFKLRSKNVNGSGTLHQFDGDNILEGWWNEEGSEGMWRIQIDE